MSTFNEGCPPSYRGGDPLAVAKLDHAKEMAALERHLDGGGLTPQEFAALAGPGWTPDKAAELQRLERAAWSQGPTWGHAGSVLDAMRGTK